MPASREPAIPRPGPSAPPDPSFDRLAPPGPPRYGGGTVPEGPEADESASAEPSVMGYLSEDPWPLAGALGLVALGFLVALGITQQGKHLIRAGIAVGLALAVIGIERAWVTDNERIEAVVYDLARAVKVSDPGAIEAHLAPDFESPGGAIGRAVIRAALSGTKFDFVRVSKLRVNAGAQSRQGTADFTAHASGMLTTPLGTHAFAIPPSGTEWSLGFREAAPGQWQVTRITPTRMPQGFSLDRLPR